MRKKFKISNLCFVILIALCSFFAFILKVPSSKAFAASEKSFCYVISNSTLNETPTINLIGLKLDSSEYMLGENLINFDEVLSAIDQDLTQEGKSADDTQVSITFEDFTLYNNWQINLSKGLIILSGNITSPSTLAVFNICAEDVNNFEFKDLLISSQSQNIIKIKQSSIKTNLKLSNSSFESLANDSYAINFENTPCDFTLSGLNNHTSTYFFNYQKSLNILFENFEESDFIVTLPSNLNNQTILNNISTTITTSFDFVPENDFYEIEQKSHWTTQKYICTSLIKLNTNLNGGLSSEAIPDSFAYGQSLTLPSSVSNEELSFAGWFGSCQIDGETYYFDNEMLLDAANAYFEKNILKTTFSTHLSDVSNNNSISNLFEEDNAANINNSNNFISLFESLDQIPTIIAKWEYKITLYTLGGEPMSPIMTSIDSNAIISTPSNNGHSFVGWFLEETLTTPANLDEIRTNISLFAKWQVNNYSITFIGSDEQSQTQTFSFGSEINFPEFTKVGHHLSGWQTEDGVSFNETIVQSSDMTLIAVFEKNTYMTFFDSDGNESFETVYSKYLEPITKPANPTKTGYTFVSWVDKDTNKVFDFSTTPAKNSTAVATWSANSYVATFIFGNNENKTIKFNEPITYIPTNPGYKLLGWYDSNNQKIETMPACNISLYPKWQAKNLVSLKLDKQTLSIDSTNLSFKVDTNLNNFVIEYYVDGQWTTQTPASLGTYDIKVTRLEDENYAAYSEILPNGFEILPKAYDLSILIFVLFVIFFIEIVIIIFVKWLIKQKQNSMVLYSVVLPFAMFDTTEFIIAIVAALLAILGFVWLIKELVSLHKTTPTLATRNDKYDNRATIDKIEDSSNDIEIEQKVEEILIKNNLIKPSKKKNQIKINTDENDYLDIYDDNN